MRNWRAAHNKTFHKHRSWTHLLMMHTKCCDNETYWPTFPNCTKLTSTRTNRIFWSHFWPTSLFRTLQCKAFVYRDLNLWISFNVQQNKHSWHSLNLRICSMQWRKTIPKVCNMLSSLAIEVDDVSSLTWFFYYSTPCRNIMHWWPSTSMKINLRINFRFPSACFPQYQTTINQFSKIKHSTALIIRSLLHNRE